MRYNADTGFQNLPDNGENGSRGFATRFVLSENDHTHYDISTNTALGTTTLGPLLSKRLITKNTCIDLAVVRWIV